MKVVLNQIRNLTNQKLRGCDGKLHLCFKTLSRNSTEILRKIEANIRVVYVLIGGFLNKVLLSVQY